MQCEYIYSIYHSNASLKKKENLFLNIGLFGFFGQENDLV